MASPQKENGYTAIASEILEQLCKLKLSSLKFRIIMTVLRYTYGYNRIDCYLSLEFIAKAVDSNITCISREINKLIDMNILKKNKQNFYFNKNYDNWDVDQMDNYPNGQIKVDQTVKSDLTKQSNLSYPNGQPINKTIKTTIKTTIKSVYTPHLADAIISWCEYRCLSEKNIKALLALIDTYRKKFSDDEIASVITSCQSENWKCIYWDRLTRKSNLDKGEFDILKNESEPDELEKLTWELLDKQERHKNADSITDKSTG